MPLHHLTEIGQTKTKRYTMKIKSSKRYEVSFDDEEVIDSLVHWLTRVRSRSDTINLACLIKNADTTLVRKGKKIILRFDWDEDTSEI